MMKQVALLRVGIDTGCGGIHSPLFSDGRFEFLCIPDKPDPGTGTSGIHTYGNMKCEDGTPWVNYFPEPKRKLMARTLVHVDPDFKTFTYGDPYPNRRRLGSLKAGDLLIFYCGLQRWDADGFDENDRKDLYLCGYFEVELAGPASSFAKRILKAKFQNNFHVRFPKPSEQQTLVLVKGGSGSRKFSNAKHKISEKRKRRDGRPINVLSTEMLEVFGPVGEINSIERAGPHFLQHQFIDRTIEFITGLGD